MVAPGRGRRSKARLSLIEDLFAISTELPWWLVAPMGAGLFYAVKYYLPARLPSAISHGWAPLLSVLAYSLLAICLVGTAVGIFRRAQERQLYADQKSIRSIRSLSWNDFERLIAEAFRRQGYNANLSNSGPDGGVDVVLTRAGQTTLVQCKQWKTARVGVKPIRELAGVVATQKGATGLFVCSGSYTREARRFAERSKIELVDGYRLAEMMGLESPTAPSPNNDPPLSPIADLIEPAINANACPSCGAELVVRKARRGIKAGSSFIGCSGFPKCKYTRDR